MDREAKEALVANYKEAFSTAGLLVLSRQSGLTVGESEELRRQAREAGVSHKVARTSQVRLALKEGPFAGLLDSVSGPISITWSTDSIAAARVIANYAEENGKVAIVGGCMPNKPLVVDEVHSLAKLPSLEVLRSQLIGLLQAPGGRIARALNSATAALPRTIKAYADKA